MYIYFFVSEKKKKSTSKISYYFWKPYDVMKFPFWIYPCLISISIITPLLVSNQLPIKNPLKLALKSPLGGLIFSTISISNYSTFYPVFALTYRISLGFISNYWMISFFVSSILAIYISILLITGIIFRPFK